MDGPNLDRCKEHLTPNAMYYNTLAIMQENNFDQKNTWYHGSENQPWKEAPGECWQNR